MVESRQSNLISQLRFFLLIRTIHRKPLTIRCQQIEPNFHANYKAEFQMFGASNLSTRILQFYKPKLVIYGKPFYSDNALVHHSLITNKNHNFV